MKNFKSLFIGLLIGALVFGGIPAIAEMISYTAYKADFPILIDGEVKELKSPAVTIDGRAYLPLRELGNILNVEVGWNDEKGQVEIGKGGKVVGVENEYLYIEIDGKEYINFRDVDKLCLEEKYSFSWGTDPDKLWYALVGFDILGLSKERLLQEIGKTEEETEDLDEGALRRKYGLEIHRALKSTKNPDALEEYYITVIEEGIFFSPEHSEFPYMTREEFETVVLPFINK